MSGVSYETIIEGGKHWSLTVRAGAAMSALPTFSSLHPGEALYRQVVPAGEYWIDKIQRGQRLRIVDLEGNQAADTLLFNAADVADRYSAVDTIREQRNVYLSCGSKLLSTAGHVLAPIVADTVGRHDTLGGACAAESNSVRYALDKRTMHSCRDSVFEASYMVLGLGDVYLGAPVATPVDPRHRLVTTKYNPARTWTPENAVGIGGAYLCVYGMEGPGGYQFVGRTCQMWNTYRATAAFARDQPWLLRFFDQVRFHPVSGR